MVNILMKRQLQLHLLQGSILLLRTWQRYVLALCPFWLLLSCVNCISNVTFIVNIICSTFPKWTRQCMYVITFLEVNLTDLVQQKKSLWRYEFMWCSQRCNAQPQNMLSILEANKLLNALIDWMLAGVRSIWSKQWSWINFIRYSRSCANNNKGLMP